MSDATFPTARIVVTLTWLHERAPVREELRSQDQPRVFGRHTHPKIRDPTVSREHFAIWCANGSHWYVKQYASRNGLRLQRATQDEMIDVLAEAPLYNGDRLLAGNTEFTFRINGVLIDAFDDPVGMAETESLVPDIPLHLHLTKRQLQVVKAFCTPEAEGTPWASNAAIAAVLEITSDAVRSHLKAIYAELYSLGLRDPKLLARGLRNFAPDVDTTLKRTTLLNIAVRAGYREP